jgi:hypothetical protein
MIGTQLISALAMPLAGAAGPVVRPAEIIIRVGETVILRGYQNAGYFLRSARSKSTPRQHISSEASRS